MSHSESDIWNLLLHEAIKNSFEGGPIGNTYSINIHRLIKFIVSPFLAPGFLGAELQWTIQIESRDWSQEEEQHDCQVFEPIEGGGREVDREKWEGRREGRSKVQWHLRRGV